MSTFKTIQTFIFSPCIFISRFSVIFSAFKIFAFFFQWDKKKTKFEYYLESICSLVPLLYFQFFSVFPHNSCLSFWHKNVKQIEHNKRQCHLKC